jgi:hypothetical protein
MLPRTFRLAGLFLVLLSAGCTKREEFTVPVRVQFEVGIKPSGELADPGYFHFNWVHVLIGRIEFDGKREAGGDIFFQTDPHLEGPYLEFDTKPVTITSLDLPQGIYNPMLWDIYLKKIEISGLTGMNLPNTGMIIYGGYEYTDGTAIDVFVCINDTELLSFRSYNPEYESEIVLSADRSYHVILLFDLYNAFLPVSRESVEMAEKSTGINGEPVIIISSNKNKNLYDHLLYRITRFSEACVF